jgi:hypothetical protein
MRQGDDDGGAREIALACVGEEDCQAAVVLFDGRGREVIDRGKSEVAVDARNIQRWIQQLPDNPISRLPDSFIQTHP